MRVIKSRPTALALLAAGVMCLGGLGAAAFAGALSGTTTSNAHHPTGKPSSDPSGSESENDEAGAPSSTPVGPDATGPAAFGLCNAFSHAKVHGKSIGHSVAFRNLARAAGGAANISAYCATIKHPGSSSSEHGKGKPSTHGHPTGKPSSSSD